MAISASLTTVCCNLELVTVYYGEHWGMHAGGANLTRSRVLAEWRLGSGEAGASSGEGHLLHKPQHAVNGFLYLVLAPEGANAQPL
jgi:hypothetical protein